MTQTKEIKSIEIFPSTKGKYDQISNFPEELLRLITPYIKEHTITVRIYGTSLFMEEVHRTCDKYNIRCQRYVI